VNGLAVDGTTWMVANPYITVRRERRWTTVGANPTRELDRSTSSAPTQVR
jgi:hypothetical protein